MALVESVGIDLARSLLIKDSLLAPGGFVLFEVLRNALKGSCQVVLLIVKEPLAHYQYVLRKLGIPLPRLLQEDRVRVISILEGQDDERISPGGLQKLKSLLLSQIKFDGGGSQVCVVIDSLSDLHSLYGADPGTDWISFLVTLSSLDEYVEGPIGIACVAHKDIADDGLWRRFVEHSFQDVIEVEPLDSGQSLEVTGQVLVTHRDMVGAASPPGHALRPRSSFLYKLTEVGCRVLQHGQQVF